MPSTLGGGVVGEPPKKESSRKKRREEEAARRREEKAEQAKTKLNEIMRKMAVLVEEKNKSPRSNIYNATGRVVGGDVLSRNTLVPHPPAAYHTSHYPLLPEDEPLRNGAGTIATYKSPLVTNRKNDRVNGHAFTFSQPGSPENDLRQPPREPFIPGSPKNHFVSKTTQSTAFAHWHEAHEDARNRVRNGTQPGQVMSPREDLQVRRKEERIPGGFRPGENNTNEGTIVFTLDSMVHPYPNVLGTGRRKLQQREDATDHLREEVVSHLRNIVPEREVLAKTDPHRDYDYAHGVMVSVPLASEEPLLRGKRVYPGIDEDYSPVVGLGLQTSRSEKEGKVERRKHIARQDRLTLRLDKKKNFREDTSIFAPKNAVVRGGLTSVETNHSSKRLGMNLPDLSPSALNSPRVPASSTRTFDRSNDIVTQKRTQVVYEARPVYVGGTGGVQQTTQPRTILLHNGYHMMGSPRVLPSPEARLERSAKV